MSDWASPTMVRGALALLLEHEDDLDVVSQVVDGYRGAAGAREASDR